MPKDSAGNYTLPAGNPVSSGEIISANWANTTMEDIGETLTASLDRYGRGGMLAPFAFADGTSSAPGATWSNEPTTGLYRNAYADLRMTVTAQDSQRWTATSSYIWRNSQWEEIITAGGSVAIDSLTITNDLSVGGDTTLTGGLTVDGTTLVVDDTNNRVGIGVTDPDAPLEVVSGVIDSEVLNLRGFNADRGLNISINNETAITDALVDLNNELFNGRISFSLGGNEKMRVHSNGFVGIGVAAPDTALHVSAVNPRIRIADNNSTAASSNSYLEFYGSDARAGVVYTDDSGLNIQSDAAGANTIRFLTSSGSGERMRIDSSGNVGIGTGTPEAILDIKGNSPRLLIEAEDNDKPRIEFKRSASVINWRQVNDNTIFKTEFGDDSTSWTETYSVTNTGNHYWNTDGMRLNTAGNLGLGGSPTTSLHVQRPAATLRMEDTNYTDKWGEFGNSAGGTFIRAQNGASNGAITFNGYNGTSFTEYGRFDSGGNFLVGKTSNTATDTGTSILPSGRLNLVNNNGGASVTVQAFYNDNTSAAGSISITSTATSYNTSSDERLKENIVDAPAGNIDALQVRSFDWKVNGEHQTYGFIAQELEAVAPYAVTTGEDDEETGEEGMKSVDYSKLIPMLVKEIQDLKAEVAALKGA